MQLLHSSATTRTQCYQTPFRVRLEGWVTRLHSWLQQVQVAHYRHDTRPFLLPLVKGLARHIAIQCMSLLTQFFFSQCTHHRGIRITPFKRLPTHCNWFSHLLLYPSLRQLASGLSSHFHHLSSQLDFNTGCQYL